MSFDNENFGKNYLIKESTIALMISKSLISIKTKSL
jgi:hypothetical protein